MPIASLFILLYLFSAPVSLLLENAMGLSMVPSGTLSLVQLAAPNPTPDTSFSMYSCLASSWNLIQASSL